jgi:hypothetical protein
MEMEPSKRYQVSDDGDGEGFKRLLGPSRSWLESRCAKALVDKNELWALRRTHEPDFLERLNRVTGKSTILRQRGFARAILLIAELLGLDAEEVGVEELRLSIQKFLRDRKEFVDLTRNRFAEVLKEMDFSRERGPTWKRIDRDGRQFVAIFPGLWRKNKGDSTGATGATGATTTHMEAGSTRTTLRTFAGAEIGPGEGVLAVQAILRELCSDGHSAFVEDVLRVAQDRGLVPDRTRGILKRMKSEGELFEPTAGTFRLTEAMR